MYTLLQYLVDLMSDDHAKLSCSHCGFLHARACHIHGHAAPRKVKRDFSDDGAATAGPVEHPAPRCAVNESDKTLGWISEKPDS